MRPLWLTTLLILKAITLLAGISAGLFGVWTHDTHRLVEGIFLVLLSRTPTPDPDDDY